MSLHERTGKRPLGFSLYHRTLPKEWSMIDIDGELYCEPCKEPLALLETVRGNGGHYKTTPTKSAHTSDNHRIGRCGLGSAVQYSRCNIVIQ